jgi:hypothetical protein
MAEEDKTPRTVKLKETTPTHVKARVGTDPLSVTGIVKRRGEILWLVEGQRDPFHPSFFDVVQW